MIRAVVVAGNKEEAKQLADRLAQAFAGCVVFEWLPLTRDMMGDIKRKAPDLLITLDLAGFDRTTFTDGVAYNLLDCKQLHLLLREGLEQETLLKKPLSIAMFFACAGETYAGYLRRNYPDIPWLEVLTEGEGAEGMVKRVLCECGMDISQVEEGV